MSNLIFPTGYRSALNLRQTQQAIKLTKDAFQSRLATALHLDRVTAPVILTAGSGLNDDLSGVERKVSFTMKNQPGEAEVVQSLAKWKRVALSRYGYRPGEGIYTDMNAIRRDDDVDNLHSLFVDQWDWEKVITAEERTLATLKKTVTAIVGVLADVNALIKSVYPALDAEVRRDVTFITTQELLRRYPALSPKARENAITREKGTVCLIGIGDPLSNGVPHDSRAPDYDDWTLNCDILVWDAVLETALEISSMGVRVNAESLRRQLSAAGVPERAAFPYHKAILEDRLPFTIGGGIGQSRICMLVLQKAHIGEVQASVWPETMIRDCEVHGIMLL